MISVLSHQPPLNGNRFLIFFLIVLAGCSPKIVIVKNPDPTVQKKTEPAKTDRQLAQKDKKVTMSLVLPFDFPTNEIEKEDISRATLALDFYQGFLLGVDSVLRTGTSFDIRVVDSKAEMQPLGPILKKADLKGSELIIGPVFPGNLKQVPKSGSYFVSPLAATMPNEFENPNIISMVPNISLHAQRIAKYVQKRPNPEKLIVVLLNSKTAESEQFGSYLRAELNNPQSKYIFQEFTSSAIFETRLQKGKEYLVIISTADKEFANQSLDKLSKIKSRLHYPIDVIGHPNWVKENLNTNQLQQLNALVPSSYFVNYKRAAVTSFLKKYRTSYQFEPSEYSFKGFDTGYYFARLLAKYGDEFAKNMVKEKYAGLQNNYLFYFDPELGYMNTGIFLLRYRNFSLLPID